jgi:hypothetical protein
MAGSFTPQLAAAFALGLVAAAQAAEPTTTTSSAAATQAASASERVGAAFELLAASTSPAALTFSDLPSARTLSSPAAAHGASSTGAIGLSPASKPTTPRRESTATSAEFPDRERESGPSRPVDQSVGGTLVAAVKAPTATPDAGMGWSVQLTGGRTVRDAQAAYSQLRKRRASLLAGRNAMILRKWVGRNDAYWHHVLVAADSLEAATRLCGRFSAAGETCVVVANEPLKDLVGDNALPRPSE